MIKGTRIFLLKSYARFYFFSTCVSLNPFQTDLEAISILTDALILVHLAISLAAGEFLIFRNVLILFQVKIFIKNLKMIFNLLTVFEDFVQF